MKETLEITGEIEWIGDLADQQVRDIHKCMKMYAGEAIQELIENETDGEGCIKVWSNMGISTDQNKLEKFKNALK